MQRHPDAYQHIDPKLVGNEMRVVVSELSGRANIVEKATQLGISGLDEKLGAKVVEMIKAKEHEGFSFEAAEASVTLLVRRLSPDYHPVFKLHDYRGMVGRHGERQSAEATIKLEVQGHPVHMVAEGNGPVNAFDTALRKALQPTFPQVAQIQLSDYKVRILNGNSGTGAITRVLIDWHDGNERRWSTVGAGTNILDATWLALADGYEFALSTAAQPAVKTEALA
jgi:2-isopropylmalate synthase